MELRKVGELRSWHQNRGFGVVQVGGRSSQDKYFLHVSKIRSGPNEPLVGSKVSFEIIPSAHVKGLPQAVRADVWVEVTAGVETLSQERVKAGE